VATPKLLFTDTLGVTVPNGCAGIDGDVNSQKALEAGDHRAVPGAARLGRDLRELCCAVVPVRHLGIIRVNGLPPQWRSRWTWPKATLSVPAGLVLAPQPINEQSYYHSLKAADPR